MSLPTSTSIRQSSLSASSSELTRQQWPTSRSTRVPSKPRRALSIGEAKSGDHAAIHHLLMSLLHGPTESEFQSNLDRPGYDPGNRLLLRHGNDLVGHIRLTRRQCRVGRAWLPTCELSEFAILPEYAGHTQVQRLLDSAAQQAVEEGAILLTTRARRGDEFPDHRWVACGDSVCWEAPPRDVLASCADELRDGAVTGHVRPWRYIEQQALGRLYEANAQHIDGAPYRDEEYWQWLLVRRGFDTILVVTTDSPSQDETTLSSSDHIVAYAFQRGSDIVEMMVSPEMPGAAILLVQRIAADAIERDDHQVRVFGPRTEPFGDVMDRILRPNEVTLQRRPSQLVRVVDEPAFVRACWEWSSGDRVPMDGRLGLLLDGAAMTVEVRDGELHVSDDKMPRAQIQARGRAVSALLFGQVDWDRIDDDPHLEVSSASAIRFATRLFRSVKLWRSTLDDLPSRK